MKKLVFLFAMVFAVTFAMAQNTANVSQTGNDHTSTNQQLGTDNSIKVVQSAEPANNPKGYISEINQTGTENMADVEQGGPTQDYPQGSNGGAKVEVAQNGVENSAIVDQNGNNGGLAKVTQVGDYQVAEVWNANGTGQATVYQEALIKNEAYLYQNRGNSNGAITQINGGGNLALVKQYRSDNSEVIQDGSDNVSYVNQSTGGGSSTANIYQYGSNNGVGTFVPGIMPGHNGGGHTATITGATVYINQGPTSGNIANINQGGDALGKVLDVFGNAAGIDQTSATNSVATITQFTDYNTANLIQSDLSNSAIVLQEGGNTNVVNLSQSDGADADIWQNGTENVVKGVGVGFNMATSLNGSTLDVDQYGTGNVLELQQTNGAFATVMQDGMTNTSVVIQN